MTNDRRSPPAGSTYQEPVRHADAKPVMSEPAHRATGPRAPVLLRLPDLYPSPTVDAAVARLTAEIQKESESNRKPRHPQTPANHATEDHEEPPVEPSAASPSDGESESSSRSRRKSRSGHRRTQSSNKQPAKGGPASSHHRDKAKPLAEWSNRIIVGGFFVVLVALTYSVYVGWGPTDGGDGETVPSGDIRLPLADRSSDTASDTPAGEPAGEIVESWQASVPESSANTASNLSGESSERNLTQGVVPASSQREVITPPPKETAPATFEQPRPDAGSSMLTVPAGAPSGPPPSAEKPPSVVMPASATTVEPYQPRLLRTRADLTVPERSRH